jgi:ethanolamine utilization protein EutQ (cupin superfamily)
MPEDRVDFEKIAWESPMKGVRFKAIRHGARQLRLVEYTREMEPHWCEKGHIRMVLEGRFEIRFEKETQIYNAGDGVFIPAGPEHKHKTRTLSEIVRAVFVEEI